MAYQTGTIVFDRFVHKALSSSKCSRNHVGSLRPFIHRDNTSLHEATIQAVQRLDDDGSRLPWRLRPRRG